MNNSLLRMTEMRILADMKNEELEKELEEKDKNLKLMQQMYKDSEEENKKLKMKIAQMEAQGGGNFQASLGRGINTLQVPGMMN